MFTKSEIKLYDEGMHKVILNILSSDDRSATIKEALNDLLSRDMLWSLIFDGKAYLQSNDIDGKVKLRMLHRFNLCGLYPFLFYKELKRASLDSSCAYQWLNPKSLICLKLPFKLKWKISNLIKSLTVFSGNYPLPKFAREDLEKGDYDPSVNYDEIKKIQLRALFKSNKVIGWNSSSFLGENVSEYYKIMLFLRFQKFILELRDCIYQQLNQAVAIAMGKKKKNRYFYIESKVTTTVIEDAFDKLKLGKVNFDDLLKPFVE